MPNTESEVIRIILRRGGKAKKGDVAKELGVSLGYLDIITRSLERRGLIKVNNNIYFLTSLGKKKLAESIQRTKKIELKSKKKREYPKINKVLKKQKADFPVAKVNGQLTSIGGETDSAKELLAETLLGQRIEELKEGVAEAEKKIEEGAKNIEEKVKPIVEKIEELPPIILQFGKFLSFTSKRIFNKYKKVKEKQIPKASLVFAKLRDFKARDKLISLPIWIAKSYKNFIKKRI